MKKFSDFNITVTQNVFTGDKIKITKILNREITVHAFKLEPSKHFKNECLHLQIEFNKDKYVLFTGSTKLIEQIQQVPASGFPFNTTIINESEMYLFS